ncbi:hypothetical protein DFH06DRAFT_1295791 [Mycena polygramma]|nr:hypothetical protein DFH06DRAFT_1295791 [Mycena polygramma]
MDAPPSASPMLFSASTTTVNAPNPTHQNDARGADSVADAAATSTSLATVQPISALLASALADADALRGELGAQRRRAERHMVQAGPLPNVCAPGNLDNPLGGIDPTSNALRRNCASHSTSVNCNMDLIVCGSQTLCAVHSESYYRVQQPKSAARYSGFDSPRPDMLTIPVSFAAFKTSMHPLTR